MAYDSDFFAIHHEGVRRSAEAVVPIIMEALHPKSVVDVGCGTGTWLAVFREQGVDEVLGLDGDYVDRATLDIPADQYIPTDLSSPLTIDRRFDLAVSLEVAEHLEPARGPSFVADLVRLAPAVCFSAAVPLQGGENHVNERWQDEWATLFEEHDYRPVDLIRKKVWYLPDVEPWYAQNTILYVEQSIEITGDDMPLRLVHPARYIQHVQPIGPRLTPRALTRAVLRRAKRQLRKLR